MTIFTKGKLDQLDAEEQVDKLHTILLVDDEEANLKVMTSILQDSYNLLTAQGGMEAMEIIKAMEQPEKLSLVISDQRMPDVTGVMLFEELTVMIPKTIRIIVTGFIDVEAIIDSVNKAHIYQFILKPFERDEFLMTIERAIEKFEMQQQREAYIKSLEESVVENTEQLEQRKQELDRAYQSLEALNMIDQLTKFNSRSFLLEHLEADLEICVKRHFEWTLGDKSQPLLDGDMAFFIVNIDQFEDITDSFGDSAGEQVLAQLKGLLLKVFRESDFLIRWGPHELLIVSRFIDRTEAANLAEDIRHTFEQHPFKVGGNPAFNKTCSIGFACYPFEPQRPQAITWLQLVEMAGVCLKAAKQTRCNAWIGVNNNSGSDIQDLFSRFIGQPGIEVKNQAVMLHSSIDDSIELKW